MPRPDLAISSQGQTVALFIATAGLALLVLALAGEGSSRLGRHVLRRRARSALVGALLLTAGLALLLVQRLDQAALPRVPATVTAAVAAAAAERERRWRTAPGQLSSLRGHPVGNFSANRSPHGLSKELS